jgi:hypothetical protein
MIKRLDSVFFGRDCDLLPQLLEFYAPTAKVIRDVTANRRRMWKGVDIENVKFYDADATMMPDVVCLWDHLPDSDGSVDVLVYDPPHLPLAAASEKSLPHMASNYGLLKSVKSDNVASLHPSFLAEAKRVLRPNGIVLAKIKDYVHSHRYQWNLEYFNSAVRSVGMVPCDLIIKRDPSAGNLKSGRWERSHHARNSHCYWVVVRNGSRCEGK